MKINYVVQQIINPKLKEAYPKSNYLLKQTVGIDTSDLYVARTGIRGSNDLVWVGRAANYAAKLTELTSDYPTRVTPQVYARLTEDLKVSQGKPMWECKTWTAMDGISIYRSDYWWRL